MQKLELIRTIALVIVAASTVKIAIDVNTIRSNSDWVAERINYIEDSVRGTSDSAVNAM